MGDKDKKKKKKSEKHKSSEKHEKDELYVTSNSYGNKALVLFGSPKKNGHTGKLVDAFLKGKNIEADYIYVNNLDIKGCQGCLHCQSNDGDCKPKDDMTELYDKIKNAKKIIIAFPIYYGSIPGEFKCMLDRIFAVSSMEIVDGKNVYKSRWENTRDVFLIVSHGNSIEPVLESVQRVIKYFCVDTNSILKGSYYSKPMDMYDLKDDNSYIKDLLDSSKDF